MVAGMSGLSPDFGKTTSTVNVAELVHKTIFELALEGHRGCSVAALWNLLDIHEPLIRDRSIQHAIWSAILERVAYGEVLVHTVAPIQEFRGQRLTPPIQDTVDGQVRFGVDAAHPALQTLDSVEQLSDDQAIHLVACRALRDAALGLDEWVCLNPLNDVQRLSLEAVGAARRAGVTQAALAKQLNLDPRNFFYVIQTLATRKLVVRTQVEHDNLGTTNLMHLTSMHPHSTAFDANTTAEEAEADATADKEDAVTGASKPPMKANDDDGMLEKICKALSEANDKVLPEARLKSFVGHVGTRGHRTWRRLRSKLEAQKRVELIQVDVQGKAHACLRLLEVKDSSEIPKACFLGDALTLEEPLNLQLSNIVKNSGHKGMVLPDLYKTSGLGVYYGNKRIPDVVAQYGLAQQMVAHQRTRVYKLTHPECINAEGASGAKVEPQLDAPIATPSSEECPKPKDALEVAEPVSTQSHDGEGELACESLERTEDASKLTTTSPPSKSTLARSPFFVNTIQQEERKRFIVEYVKANGYVFHFILRRLVLEHEQANKLTQTNKMMDIKTLRRIIATLEKSRDLVRYTIQVPQINCPSQSKSQEIYMHPSKYPPSAEFLTFILHESVSIATGARRMAKRQIPVEELEIDVPRKQAKTSSTRPKNRDSTANKLLKDSADQDGASNPTPTHGSKVAERVEAQNNGMVDVVTEQGRNGFVSPKNVRLRLLHHFLWKYLLSRNAGVSEPEAVEAHKDAGTNPSPEEFPNPPPDWSVEHDPKVIISFNEIHHNLPLETYCQIMGLDDASAPKRLLDRCVEGAVVGDLCELERNALWRQSKSSRFSNMIRLLQEMKLLHKYSKPQARGAAGGLVEASVVLFAQAILDVPSRAHDDAVLLPAYPLTSPPPQVTRHLFEFRSIADVARYWRTMEQFYQEKFCVPSYLNVFPACKVPELLNCRSWSTRKLMSAAQRRALMNHIAELRKDQEMFQRVAGPCLTTSKAAKLATELGLGLAQVLDISYQEVALQRQEAVKQGLACFPMLRRCYPRNRNLNNEQDARSSSSPKEHAQNGNNEDNRKQNRDAQDADGAQPGHLSTGQQRWTKAHDMQVLRAYLTWHVSEQHAPATHLIRVPNLQEWHQMSTEYGGLPRIAVRCKARFAHLISNTQAYKCLQQACTLHAHLMHELKQQEALEDQKQDPSTDTPMEDANISLSQNASKPVGGKRDVESLLHHIILMANQGNIGNGQQMKEAETGQHDAQDEPMLDVATAGHSSVLVVASVADLIRVVLLAAEAEGELSPKAAGLLCRFNETYLAAAFSMLFQQQLLTRAKATNSPIKFRLTPHFHLCTKGCMVYRDNLKNSIASSIKSESAWGAAKPIRLPDKPSPGDVAYVLSDQAHGRLHMELAEAHVSRPTDVVDHEFNRFGSGLNAWNVTMCPTQVMGKANLFRDIDMEFNFAEKDLTSRCEGECAERMSDSEEQNVTQVWLGPECVDNLDMCVQYFSSESCDEEERLHESDLRRAYAILDEAGVYGLPESEIADRLKVSETVGIAVMQALGNFDMIRRVNHLQYPCVILLKHCGRFLVGDISDSSSRKDCKDLSQAELVPSGKEAPLVHPQTAVDVSPTMQAKCSTESAFPADTSQALGPVVSEDVGLCDDMIAEKSQSVCEKRTSVGEDVSANMHDGHLQSSLPSSGKTILGSNGGQTPSVSQDIEERSVRPWLTPTGAINQMFLWRLQRSLVCLVMNQPGIPMSTIAPQMTALAPQTVKELVDSLVVEGVLKVHVAIAARNQALIPRLLRSSTAAKEDESVVTEHYFVNIDLAMHYLIAPSNDRF